MIKQYSRYKHFWYNAPWCQEQSISKEVLSHKVSQQKNLHVALKTYSMQKKPSP